LDSFATKTAAQPIRKPYDFGWKPLHIIAYPASSLGVTLRAAGPKSQMASSVRRS
jgi:hypothetical protein